MPASTLDGSRSCPALPVSSHSHEAEQQQNSTGAFTPYPLPVAHLKCWSSTNKQTTQESFKQSPLSACETLMDHRTAGSTLF